MRRFKLLKEISLCSEDWGGGWIQIMPWQTGESPSQTKQTGQTNKEAKGKKKSGKGKATLPLIQGKVN